MGQRVQTIAITGAAGGIGQALVAASRVAWPHSEVLAIDRDPAAVDRVFANDPAVVTLAADFTAAQAVSSLGRELARRGGVDVLVNNAGYGGPFDPIDALALEVWETVFAVNVRAPFQLAQALLPLMAGRGWGRIVNIASILGLRGGPGSAAYAASKHALVGLTRSIAVEWGGQGIRANAICPGYIATAMGIQASEVADHEGKVLAMTPTAELGQPQDVADAMVYAVNDRGYLNGAVLNLDGGITCHTGTQ